MSTRVLEHARADVRALLFSLQQIHKHFVNAHLLQHIFFCLLMLVLCQTHTRIQTRSPPHLVLLSGTTPETIACSLTVYGQQSSEGGHLEGIRVD